MFTGLVEETGLVAAAGEGRLIVHAETALDGTAVGDSVSVNGACLTVTDIQEDRIAFDLMPETLRRTNLGEVGPGSTVNLERSLLFNGRVGGHLVQGHVDGTGKILSMTSEGDAVVVRFSVPSEVLRYVVQKGFIAVDGVSLTVMGLDDESFSVSLVRYTFDHTVFGGKQPGDMVNLEIDILAKYVERLLHGERDGSLAEIGGEDDAGR
ncbi:MAG: riboflavin synthase [Dehalococcoidia bacterium]|jgi:riboflavin synthase|nr:riboflavin synthase [Dehalococcoidia bacterium]